MNRVRRYRFILILPVIHFLIFFALFFFVAFMGFSYFFGTSYVHYAPILSLLRHSVQHLVPILVTALPPTLLLSLFPLLLVCKKKGIPRAASIILPVFSSTLLYILLFTALQGTTHTAPDVKVFGIPFQQQTVHLIQEGAVYPHKVNAEENFVADTLIIRTDSFPGITYEERMYYREPSLITEDETTLIVEPINPYYSTLYEQPPFLVTFFEDIGYLHKSLSAHYREQPIHFIVIILIQVILVISLVRVILLSKWPLFSLLLGMTFFRLLFALYRALHTELLEDMVLLISGESIIRYFPVAALSAAALLLFLISLFLGAGEKHA